MKTFKTLKTYSEFVAEKKSNEKKSNTTNGTLNEGILKNISDFFNRFWNGMVKKFGNKAWLNYLVFLKESGALKGKKKDKLVVHLPNDNIKHVDVEDIISDVEAGEDTDIVDNKIDNDVEMDSDTSIDKANMEAEEDEELMKTESIIGLQHPNPNIVNIGFDDLVKTLLRKFKMRSQNSTNTFATFIWGAPGIGKTDVVIETARTLGVPLLEFRLSQMEPSDFIGCPKTLEEDKSTVFYLPRTFPREGDSNNGGIIFLDEMNQAAAPVLAASYSLCLSGKVGSEYTLPKGWLVIAAGNRKEEADNVTPMPVALSNRFSHVNFTPTPEDWLKWAMNTDYMNGDVITFIKLNKDKLHMLDIDSESEAWPSPRSWAESSREYMFELEQGHKLSNNEIKSLFAEKLGMSVASEFAEYISIKDVFPEDKIEMVYNSPNKVKFPEGLRADQQNAVLHFIAYYKKNQHITQKQMENVWDFAIKMKNFELATNLITYFVEVHPYLEREYKESYNDKKLEWHDQHDKILNTSRD